MSYYGRMEEKTFFFIINQRIKLKQPYWASNKCKQMKKANIFLNNPFKTRTCEKVQLSPRSLFSGNKSQMVLCQHLIGFILGNAATNSASCSTTACDGCVFLTRDHTNWHTWLLSSVSKTQHNRMEMNTLVRCHCRVVALKSVGPLKPLESTSRVKIQKQKRVKSKRLHRVPLH